MKHTQGEWIQNGYNGVHLKTGECIAITEGENRKANAVLISAAPNLLEACKSMIQAFKDAPIEWLMTNDVMQAESIMIDAINKATE